MTAVEPTHAYKTCKTHDVKWDEDTEQGKLENLNHNEEYGCEVVDGEHTVADEEAAEATADQNTAAEATPNVGSKSKSSSYK